MFFCFSIFELERRDKNFFENGKERKCFVDIDSDDEKD
jgi:hypothetical protein